MLILVYISAYIGRQNSYDPWYCIKSQHVIGHLLYELQAYQEISYDFEAHSELPFQRCDRIFFNHYLLQFHIKEANLYGHVGWLGCAERITKILVLSIHFTPQLVRRYHQWAPAKFQDTLKVQIYMYCNPWCHSQPHFHGGLWPEPGSTLSVYTLHKEHNLMTSLSQAAILSTIDFLNLVI